MVIDSCRWQSSITPTSASGDRPSNMCSTMPRAYDTAPKVIEAAGQGSGGRKLRTWAKMSSMLSRVAVIQDGERVHAVHRVDRRSAG